MVKIVKSPVLQDLRPYEVNMRFSKIEDIINGRLGFGDIDGRDRNIDGEVIEYTFTTAATEYAIPHTLKTIPLGYMMIGTSNGGVVYDGTTDNTKTNLYLQSTTNNNTVKLFIVR